MPLADRAKIFSSNPSSRRCPSAIDCGPNVPSRSRGVLRASSPMSPPAAFSECPLRRFLAAVGEHIRCGRVSRFRRPAPPEVDAHPGVWHAPQGDLRHGPHRAVEVVERGHPRGEFVGEPLCVVLEHHIRRRNLRKGRRMGNHHPASPTRFSTSPAASSTRPRPGRSPDAPPLATGETRCRTPAPRTS